MAKHIETGRLGEEIALKLLENKAYIIHELNWRFRHKEIDIIAQEGEELVFVEVKTRRSQAYGTALQAIDVSKQRNMIQAANYYIQSKQLPYRTRFDIIAIDFETQTDYKIEHIQNAFYPTYDIIGSQKKRGKSIKHRLPQIK